MSLRYVVPTLGLVAFTAAPAMAADVGGLTINGYVDSILEFSTADEGIADPDDDTVIDFSAFAQLEVGYQIGDAVSANAELGFDEDGFAGDNLEQAYASWAINEQVSLVMGRFHNWIGWEGRDAPELYRVNNSYMYGGGTQAANAIPASAPTLFNGGAWGMNGGNVTGLGAIITPSEQFELGVFIVDAIWSEDGIATAGDGRTRDSVSFGAYGTYTMEGVGYFDLDLAFGVDEGADEDGEASSIFQIDFNGEIDMLREDNGLLFAYDLSYTDYDTAAALGFLALANYALPTEIPASLTLSLNYWDPVDDDDVAEDDETIEIAVALLANPTDDENFSTNVELQYLSRSADDANELGIFIEALAVIP